jgi:hypothetical protein
MQMTSKRYRAYLKKTCPYCLKFRIFVTEAGLAGNFDFTVFNDGDDTHKALRARMEAAGQEPAFPAVEDEGRLATGTDALIARFAGDAGVDAASLPLLNYYAEGVFQRHVAMFRELRELKGK